MHFRHSGWLHAILQTPVGLRPQRRWARDRLGMLETWYAKQPRPRVVTVALECKQAYSENQLRTALRQLRERHPAHLTVTLGQGPRPRWLRLPPGTPLPCRSHRSSTASAQDLMQELLHQPFTPREPLWRARWCSDGRLIGLAFHHVIADGHGAAMLACELGQLLSGEVLPPPARLPALPLDCRLDLRPTLGQLLTALTSRPQPTHQRANSLHSYYAGPPPANDEFRTALYGCMLAPRLVRQLISRARSEGTTVHGALSAAALAASARQTRLWPVTVKLASPISLRPYATPQPTGLGVFVCSQESVHELRPGQSFWQLAREYRRLLSHALPAAYQQLGLLAFVGNLADLAKRLDRTSPNGRTSTVEVSNLGQLQLPPVGHTLYFAQGNHYHGPLFNLSTVTTKPTTAMQVTLAVADALVPADRAQRFITDFAGALENAVHLAQPTLADTASARGQGDAPTATLNELAVR